jgi:hypothetical protein
LKTDAADAVVFVLVDALRADYIGRTAFLQQLAERSLTGRLEEPFGFWPHGAYFGGLSVAEQGFTNLFRFDPASSVFSWTRALGRGGGEAARDRYRDAILDRARSQLPSWSAAYVDTFDIPLSRLSSFDVSARHPAWSREVGYRSLFHLLDEAGMRWLEISWPFEGRGTGTTSGQAATEAIAALRSDHRFAFIHLPDLDLAGHLHGPGSIALQQTLRETDRLCKLIVERATALYRDPVVVFAGDHGMLPVVQSVDAEAALAGTSLRWGYDLAYFIDSSMVRCWFFTRAARRRAMAAMTAAGGGHFLTADQKDRYELTGIDARNGAEIYLADPGVVFCPNYFNWSGQQSLRGMHGYAPDVPDNRAGLIVHRPRGRASCGEVGAIAARRLFPSFLRWLGFDHQALTKVEPVPSAPTRERKRWTFAGDAAAERVIETHLARITAALQARVPDADAIILTGSFGRGEGSLSGDPAPGRPANDYDVVVVGGTDAQLAGVAASLAAELGIDFVDVTRVDHLEASDAPSQFDYDLRYGSRTLAGDPRVLARLPLYAPVQIGVPDGVLQIGNRAGGLLLALTGSFDPRDSAELFLARQTMKFLMAVADCALVVIGDYHPSYAVRRERFRALAPAAGFSDVVSAWIGEGFAAKLGETPPTLRNKDESAATATVALDELQRSACGLEDFDTALDGGFRQRTRLGPQWLERASGHGLRATAAAIDDPLRGVEAVCRACVHAVRSWSDGPAARTARVETALAPAFVFEPPRPGADVLGAVARTWLSLFH